MPKKYKHKTLWWIADIDNDWDACDHLACILNPKGGGNYTSPRELVENSQDREEIKEDDWIDWLIHQLACDAPEWNHDQWMRKVIEAHMPKVSEEELTHCEDEVPDESAYEMKKGVRKLLKGKWLYQKK